MIKLKSIFLFSCLSVLAMTSCNDDDNVLIEPATPVVNAPEAPPTSTLTLDISGLEDLGEDYAYEGWIIVDGVPKTAGIFTVDANGELSQKTFELDAADLKNTTAYALTIEPSPDTDPAPSKVHVLAGDFSGNSSNLTLDHPLAITTDFTEATGGYLLGTPTDGSLETDELSGIWWEDLGTNPPSASLNLPPLPEGWEYEGWVVVDGIPLSTGRFLEVDEADFGAPFSGSSAGPPFPGEDFIINAPEGLTFPLDLSGAITAITVEPSPDNSPAPFLLKPLLHTIPSDATFHTGYQMDNNASASNPIGTVTK